MSRAGSTLIELLVALAVLAIALAVSVVAFRTEESVDPRSQRLARVSAARREAVGSGHPVVVRDAAGASGTAYPDGRVLLDSILVDPMSGRPDAR